MPSMHILLWNVEMNNVCKMQYPVLIFALVAIVYAIDGDYIDPLEPKHNITFLQLPEASFNISSILCIIKFCEKYFRSKKAVIGSLVIVNYQDTTEFHTELIIMLNEHANYELGVMTKDARKYHFPPTHGNFFYIEIK